jgi:hypothetical protein
MDQLAETRSKKLRTEDDPEEKPWEFAMNEPTALLLK